MNREEKSFLWLSMIDFIGNKKAFSLIDSFGSVEELYDRYKELSKVFTKEEFEGFITLLDKIVELAKEETT